MALSFAWQSSFSKNLSEYANVGEVSKVIFTAEAIFDGWGGSRGVVGPHPSVHEPQAVATRQGNIELGTPPMAPYCFAGPPTCWVAHKIFSFSRSPVKVTRRGDNQE
jgi:hypothetical protein